MKRIGIFGGVFNPIHTAHLIMAESVREQMSLEKVLFVVAANPPHKDSGSLPDASLRFKMVRQAIEGNKNFEASDIEIQLAKNGKSFTVNTLMALREKYNSEANLYLIIGMDQLIELNTWKEPEKLFKLAEVVVINRPGYNVPHSEIEFGKQVNYVQVPDIDISSTDIRHRIRKGKSIKYLVPEITEKFIYENNLYKS